MKEQEIKYGSIKGLDVAYMEISAMPGGDEDPPIGNNQGDPDEEEEPPGAGGGE